MRVADVETRAARRSFGRLRVVAGFQVSINGRLRSTEGPVPRQKVTSRRAVRLHHGPRSAGATRSSWMPDRTAAVLISDSSSQAPERRPGRHSAREFADLFIVPVTAVGPREPRRDLNVCTFGRAAARAARPV